jgi:hypothetical protein
MQQPDWYQYNSSRSPRREDGTTYQEFQLGVGGTCAALYSPPAGIWKGRKIRHEYSEWLQASESVPRAEYRKLARRFNPTGFDADEWMQQVSAAGMKYFLITAKHHDGFALWPSKVSPFNVADATPFRRDVLGELAAAAKRHGIKFRTLEESPTCVTIRAERGDEAEESTWTIERAQKAGFTNNKKYSTEPQQMLYAKCAMEVSRRIAPDILLGIAYSTEELELSESQQSSRPVQSQRPAPAAPRRGVEGLRNAIAPAAPVEAVVVDVEPEPEPAPEPAPAKREPGQAPTGMAPTTRKKWVASMFAALAEADCPDRDDQLIVITHLAQRHQNPPEHRDAITDDELRQVVNALNAARKDGVLGQAVTDILNNAALAEAGITEDDDDLFAEDSDA